MLLSSNALCGNSYLGRVNFPSPHVKRMPARWQVLDPGSCLRKGRCAQETPHVAPTLNKDCCCFLVACEPRVSGVPVQWELWL